MITKEELQSFSGTDEGRAVLAEIGLINQDQFKGLLETETKGLAESKSKILGEKKTLEEKFKSFSPKLEAFDRLNKILEGHEIVLDNNGQYDFNSLEDLIIKGKTGTSQNADLTELTKKFQAAQREARDIKLEKEQLAKQFLERETGLNEANEFMSDMLIRGELQKELIKEGYQPIIIDSIIPSLINQSGATVEIDSENSKSRRAVTKEGDTIQKFVSLWKDSDVGKALRSASLNTGGGAGHSGGAIGTKSNLQTAYDEAKKGGNFAQQTAILREAGRNGITINQ
jgi:hypothetical protein